MPKAKCTPKPQTDPIPFEDIDTKIKVAERKQKAGKRESVLLTEENLKDILALVERHDILATQALRKAINVGLKVLVAQSDPPTLAEKSIHDDIDMAKERLAQSTSQRDVQDEEDAFTGPHRDAQSIQELRIDDVPLYLQGTGAASV
jgi:hypothetical protein